MEKTVRIKGKWIGQIVLDMEVDVATDVMNKRDLEKDKAWFAELCTSEIKKEMEGSEGGNGGCKVTMTVTKFHAELCRDEPSEWTKEEATP